MNIWNEICRDVHKERTLNGSEKEYQRTIVAIFRYLLGWSRERVEEQYKVRVGSSVNHVFPDLVFFIQEEPVFVVELKKPNHIQSANEVEQLISYMKLLSVRIGLYVGEHIELFYMDPLVTKEPECIVQIKFEEDSVLGETFVDLFSRDKFSLDDLALFCKIQEEKRGERRRLEDYIGDLISDADGFLKELLKENLCAKGYSDSCVDEVLEGVNICMKKNKANVNPSVMMKEDYVLHRESSVRDRTKYSLNGKGRLGKGRLALAIVKLFVKKNPNLTYDEIKRRVPLYIETCENIERAKADSADKSKDRRWFEEELDLMVSADGVKFAFTTQIGKFNVGEIIKFGEEQGFDIQEV